MKTFMHKDKQVAFKSVTGEVVGARKHAETHISGGGGGGSTFNGHGHTAPVRINSTIVVKQEFFLKPGGGKQIPVQLSAEDIPLTDGQNVTMVSGHAGNADKWTHLVNHNAELYWRLGDAGTHAVAWGLVRKPLFSFLIGVAIWVAIGYAVNGAVGFLAAAAFWTYETMNLWAVSKALKTHFDELGKEILTNGTASL